jgi:hypothetical protein
LSGEPAVGLVITTVRLGRFFQAVGRPTSAPLQPPTADELVQFVAAAARYGYTLFTAEEKATAEESKSGLPMLGDPFPTKA